MNSPLRWLNSPDAPFGAPQLLAAAPLAPAYTADVKQRLALVVAHTAALPVAAGWSALLAKSVVAVGVATASGFVVHAAATTPTSAGLTAPVVVKPPALRPLPAVAPLPPAAVEPVASAAPGKAPPVRLDPRVQETELLERARGLLIKNPSAALKLASQHGREFPKGRLGAEAELIGAQALLGMGRTAAAKERAHASLRRNPNSIYAAQLQRIIAGE